MASTIKDRPDLRIQKHETELAARRWIESKGGAFIKINWNKGKIHWLNSAGNKSILDVSYAQQ